MKIISVTKSLAITVSVILLNLTGCGTAQQQVKSEKPLEETAPESRQAGDTADDEEQEKHADVGITEKEENTDSIPAGRRPPAMPPGAEKLFKKAVNSEAREDYEQAEAHYRDALSIAPGHPLILKALGKLIIDEKIQNATEIQAVAYLGQAADYLGNDAEAWFLLGRALMKAGKYAAAAEAFKTTTLIQPENVEAFILLSKSLFNSRDLPGALSAAAGGLKTNPRSALVHANFGMLLQADGKCAPAIMEIQQAVDIEPANAGYRNMLGTVLLSCSKTEKAVIEFDTAARIEPGKSSYRINQAFVLYKMKEFNKARRILEKTIEKDPCNASAWNNMGLIHHAQGMDGRARKAFEKALECDPDHLNARENLKALSDK